MDFDQITVKDSPGLCRCCLSEGCYKDLAAEYNWMGDNEVYADMLLECFDIGISQHMDGPNGPSRLICEVCITRLRDACNFKKQVVASEKKFIDMLGRGEFQSKVMVYEADMKVEPPLDLQTEDGDDGIEYLEEIDFDDDEPLKNLASTSKSAEISPTKRGRGRPKKSEGVPEKKPKTSKDDQKKVSKNKTIVKGAKTMEDKCKKMETARKILIKRRNIEYVLMYTNVTPFLWFKGKFKCFYCNEQINNPETLREHTVQFHHDANIELTVHDRTLANKDAAVKIDVKDLKCVMCSQNIHNLEHLINHLIIAHDADYDVNETNCFLPFLLDTEKHTCPTCNQKFVFFEYLLRHANKHHLLHGYMCDICGTSFQGENHMQMHKRYYHREGGYLCDYCGESLSTLSKKNLHEKNIHSANLLTCPQCPETFKSPYFKKLHLANIHGVEELRFKCKFCSRVYSQKSIMSRHMRRVHLREKNVECEVCGDKFFGSYDLKLHMVIHTGDRKYVCAVCGKRFAKKTNLNTHAVTHTGTKKFVCVICSRPFGHQNNLKMHIKSRHPQYEIVEQYTRDNLEGVEVVEMQLPESESVVEPEIVQMEQLVGDLDGSEIVQQCVLDNYVQ